MYAEKKCIEYRLYVEDIRLRLVENVKSLCQFVFMHYSNIYLTANRIFAYICENGDATATLDGRRRSVEAASLRDGISNKLTCLSRSQHNH